ncbi:MAG TPA: Fic/DOC family N-terminal domain-containing protein, partial [Thermoanaerobaculia bacterium]|nr:Fic/DOC family N-terminal domain-containing protein [Thermoanaerobaculia bacterium]
MERTAGRWTTSATVGETVRAFVPRPLPPEPALALDHADLDLLARANQAVGRLDGLASMIPDPALFIYFYLRK